MHTEPSQPSALLLEATVCGVRSLPLEGTRGRKTAPQDCSHTCLSRSRNAGVTAAALCALLTIGASQEGAGAPLVGEGRGAVSNIILDTVGKAVLGPLLGHVPV